MVKEKGFNPVQAQRKADKAKEIKKGKAEVQARRNERLAKRNPDGIQRQVDELKKITGGGGRLTRHEEQVLEGLEKELKAVIKAREALGDRAPQFSSRPREAGGDRGALGKRRRGDDGGVSGAGGRGRRGGRESDSDSDEVPDDVREIPMPRDTPPPIPKEVLDRWWARRRAKRGAGGGGGGGGGAGSNANAEPLANDRGLGGDGGGGGVDGAALPPPPPEQQRQSGRLPQRPPPAEHKVVYEAKPVVRNLLKEATSAFVPAAVASKMAMGKGQGGRLMEPEEADRLESEGYMKKTAAGGGGGGGDSGGSGDAEQEEQQATSRLHQVTLEEVDDEDEGR